MHELIINCILHQLKSQKANMKENTFTICETLCVFLMLLLSILAGELNTCMIFLLTENVKPIHCKQITP